MKRILPIIVTILAAISCSEEEVAVFGSLSGLVKDAETKAPIYDARVTLSPSGVSIFTAKDGTFQLNNLDPADYTVTISANGYEGEEQRVSIKPGVDAALQVSLIAIKPVLNVSAHVLDFGKENTKLSFDISNAGKGNLEWSISEDVPWLSVSPLNGSNKTDKSSVVVTVSRDGLDGGGHTGSIVIASNGGSETVVATMDVEVLTPVLYVSTHVLDFGKDNTTLSVDISNTGTGTLEWSVSEDIPWMSVSPDKGSVKTGKSTAVFTVSRNGLENGSHTKSFVISSNGGSETLVATLTVDVLNLTVTPSELDFGTVESTLQLTLKNTGNGSVKYTARSDNSWCAPNKTSGTVSDTDYLNVVVSRGDLAAGKYNSTVYISTNGGEIAVPVKMEVVERQMPTVTLESVEDIDYNSATAKGTLLSVGSEAVTRYGVCYATNDSPTVSDKVLSLGDAKKAQSFQNVLTGLQSETTYYVRAFAENPVGLVYSERTIRFTTTGLPTVPSVETGSVEEITSTSAKARGTVTSLGNVEKVTAYGHVWGLSPNPSLSSNAGKSNNGQTLNTLSYVSSLSSLKVNTTYYVRAYATNEKGTSYGDEVSFTTEKGDVKLTTSEATEIIHNAATAGGTITSDGGNTITEAGICYGTTSSLDISGSHVAADLNGSSFSARITGLATETNYYIRAYAKTDSGKVFYGSTRQFTTTKEVKLPTLGAVTVTNIKTDGATLSSRVQNNGNSTILENGFCWSEYGTPTIDNDKVSCSVSTNFGTTITGLKDGTTYHVCSWARNAMGVAYSSETTFTTVAITPPVVSMPQMINVNMEWATAKATVTSNGNSHLTDAGFCISTSPEPTVYDGNHQLGPVTDLKVTFENLTRNTTYYIRAYAENQAGLLAYSPEVSFTTTDSDPTVWDGHSTATSFAGGVGSSTNPIIISTAAQLRLFAERVNSGDNFDGAYFKLINDIDWNGEQWMPVGFAVGYAFKGVFDGGGHVVKNLVISQSNLLVSHKEYSWSDPNTLYGGAFFGNIENATIVNLTVSGINNIQLKPEEQYFHANAIAGIAASGTGNIINCLNLMVVVNGCGIVGHQSYLYFKPTGYSNNVFIANCVNHADAMWGLAGTHSYDISPVLYHSYWLNDTVTGTGSSSSGAYANPDNGNTYGKITDCYSYTRSSDKCLLAPSYSTSLINYLNYWVDHNNDSTYGHLCSWQYVNVDGYAMPVLIPED